jgi:hypothetical protein
MGLRSVCLIGPIEALRLAHTANIFLLHFAPYHSINFHKLCRLCHITREQKRNSSSFYGGENESAAQKQTTRAS